MQLIQSIQNTISYLQIIVAGSKEHIQDGFNQKFSKVKRTEADFFTSVTCGVSLATTVTCLITRTINLVAIALLFIGVGTIVVPVFKANAQSNPTVTVWTLYTEFADSDFHEWYLSISSTRNSPLTVAITEGGTATRSGNAITEVTIPANTKTVSSRQTFSSVGTYTVEINASSSYGFGFSRNISATVVDGTNLPVVSLDAAPTVTSSDTEFMLTARVNPAPTTGSRLSVRYLITDYGTNAGFFNPGSADGFANRWANISDSGSESFSITLERMSMVDGDGIVRVELLPHPGYKLSRTAAVRDVSIPSHTNTGIPEILLKDVPDTVTQGFDFSFTIEADGTIDVGGLPVTVQFGEGSATIITGISPRTHVDYVDGGNSTITIPQSGSIEVTVSTTNPSGPADQNLTITLTGAGTTYTISNSAGSGSKTVLSKDNSSPSSSRPSLSLKPFPSKPVSASVENSITFKILASHEPNSLITANFRATVNGVNFLNANYNMGTQQLSTSGVTTDLEIQVAVPPGGSQQTGMITVILLDGTGYTLADDPSHKTTANMTSARPVISVIGLMGSVTQGYPFSFKVEVSTAIFSTLPVRIQLNDSNSGVITGATPSGVFAANSIGEVTIPTSGSREVTVMTQNPSTGMTGDINGNITLYLQESRNNYDVEGGAATRAYPIVLKDNAVTTALQPRVSISSAATNLVQADQNATADFTITATPQPTGTIRVSYDVSETGNFVSVESDTIVLSTSTTTTTLAVPTTDSNSGTDDANSTITVTLVDGSNYTLADSPGHSATRIAIDDALPELTIEMGSLAEGAMGATGKMKFTVRASRSVTTPFTVNWETSIVAGVDTATDGTDFTSANSMLSFGVGDTMKTFEVDIKGDDDPEPNETFTVTLLNVGPGATISNTEGTAKGTITNDDGTGLRLEAKVMDEGNTGTTNMVFTVFAVPPSSDEITFTWTSSKAADDDAIAGTDFVATSNTATIGANAESGAFNVEVMGDETSEPDETFTVTISNPSTTPAQTPPVSIIEATVKGRITNDDGTTLEIELAELAEGADNATGMMMFTVKAIPPNASGFSATWTTSDEQDDLATENVDYNKGTGTVNIAANAETGTFEVDIIGDDIAEFDETFTVTLTNPSSGAKISDTKGSAKGTINNDDGTGIRVLTASENEGAAGETPTMTFTVEVVPPINSPITYDWATSTESGDQAVAGTDYTASSGDDITIAADAETSSFEVRLIGDNDSEIDESFTVTLSDVTSGIQVLEDGMAKGTIKNDDGSELSIAASSLMEGAANATGKMEFTVTADPPATTPFTVQWATSIEAGVDTAIEDDDYTKGMGTLNFAVNDPTKTFEVDIIGDNVPEINETFTVTLSMPGEGAYLSTTKGSAKGTITNDDGSGLSIQAVSLSEGNSGVTNMEFTILVETTKRNSNHLFLGNFC